MTYQAEDSTELITSLFWRKITRGDFFNLERSRDVGPTGGGGQLYIDIPLGGGISLEEFGRFISGAPLDDDDSNWDSIEVRVGCVSDPTTVTPLTLTPRRGQNRRYRIANQNRQAAGGSRHPAWTDTRGFPRAPDDISSLSDSRMPDLSLLKVYIARSDQGRFYAGFTNTTHMPLAWPRMVGLEVLFEPNSEVGADGIFQIPASQQLSLVRLGGLIPSQSGGIVSTTQPLYPRVRLVRRSTSSPASRRGGTTPPPSSTTPRSDPAEQISIQAPRSSEAEDLVENVLRTRYAGRCIRRIGHTGLERVSLNDGFLPGADLIVEDPQTHLPERFAEVKSSSDTMPTSVHLTASELQRAKKCAADGVPYDIWIVVFGTSLPTATIIPNFERDALTLTIDELVGVEIRVR